MTNSLNCHKCQLSIRNHEDNYGYENDDESRVDLCLTCFTLVISGTPQESYNTEDKLAESEYARLRLMNTVVEYEKHHAKQHKSIVLLRKKVDELRQQCRVLKYGKAVE